MKFEVDKHFPYVGARSDGSVVVVHSHDPATGRAFVTNFRPEPAPLDDIKPLLEQEDMMLLVSLFHGGGRDGVDHAIEHFNEKYGPDHVEGVLDILIAETRRMEMAVQ